MSNLYIAFGSLAFQSRRASFRTNRTAGRPVMGSASTARNGPRSAVQHDIRGWDEDFYVTCDDLQRQTNSTIGGRGRRTP